MIPKSTNKDARFSVSYTVEKGYARLAFSYFNFPDTIKIRKPLNKVGSGYKLYYKYKDGTYEETGYYYKNGTSRNEGKVTLVDVGNTVTEINLTTLLFTNINGKVYLPDDDEASDDGIEVTVTAYNNGSLTSSSDDFISKGSNNSRGSFFKILHTDGSGKEYRLYRIIYGG